MVSCVGDVSAMYCVTHRALSQVTSQGSRAFDCTSAYPSCYRRLCHLDTVDRDHPWSLMGGCILVVVSLCRRAGRKYFKARYERLCCMSLALLVGSFAW